MEHRRYHTSKAEQPEKQGKDRRQRIVTYTSKNREAMKAESREVYAETKTRGHIKCGPCDRTFVGRKILVKGGSEVHRRKRKEQAVIDGTRTLHDFIL